MKTNGQQPKVAKLELLADSRARSLRVEQRTVNPLHASSTLVAPATLIRPAGSCYYQQGIASGKPKAGLLRSTVILSLRPEESKAQSDLPQLPYRMPQVREA